MGYEFIVIAAGAALLSYFLDYCLGNPASDNFSAHEIFSGYSIWLAKRKLRIYNLYNDFVLQKERAVENGRAESDKFVVRRNFNKMLFNKGREFFTWEYAAGMCPVCTNFWLANFVFLISLLFIPLPVYEYGLGILLSNFFIRIILKL